MRWLPVPISLDAKLGDHRRFPLCRVVVACVLCGWSKGYSPERMIARLHELKAGGHPTPMADIARRIGWTCPGCGRVKWRAMLAWPPGVDEAEVQRLTRQLRS